MSNLNSRDYTYQQVGWSQGTEISTGIHDHILCKGALTQSAGKHQPARSRKAHSRNVIKMIQGLFNLSLS